MAKKSRPTASGGFRLGQGDVGPTPLKMAGSSAAAATVGVSISLKYYRREVECFSDWDPNDLGRFSKLIDKLRDLTPTQLRSHARLCAQHKGGKRAKRYSLPAGLASDAALFELKVDPSNAARVHGVFDGSVFHLVWLDASHQVFPW